MQLEYAKNPVWANAEHTMIDLTIKWKGWDEELPFTAAPNDSEEHGCQLYRMASNGEFGPIDEYTPPPEPEPDPKLVGIEFEGVMCSATSQDASGILQIEATIRLTGDALAPMHFENGSILRITKDNFADFMAVWAPFRASFFID